MKTFVRFGGAAALALLSYTVADAGDREGTWATLEEVQATPDAWLNTTFTFEGRYHRLGEIYQPFFTVFNTFRHVNFAAWDEGKDLRHRENFVSSFPLLYMDRTSQNSIENLHALHPYQRFQATAVVKSVFDHRPFVQVIDIVGLDKELSADEVRVRAFTGADLAAAGCGCKGVAHLAAHKSIKQPEVRFEIGAPITSAQPRAIEITDAEIHAAEIHAAEIHAAETHAAETHAAETHAAEFVNPEPSVATVAPAATTATTVKVIAPVTATNNRSKGG